MNLDQPDREETARVTSAHTWYERREQRRRERVRRRGGHGRGPVVLQRTAMAVAEALEELRYRAGRVVRGDRPLVLMLLGAVALGVVLLSGPAQSYLEARGRVESLQVKAAALDAENERLERRVRDLQDPVTIELLAREEQGFIQPGEVPYTLVPPEVARPRITAPRAEPVTQPGSWYERAWASVNDWLE